MWIGLNDIEHEGTFTWEVDKSSTNFINWASGEPNNDYNQDCATVGAKILFGRWDDNQCYKSFLYICEKPAKGKCKHVVSALERP